MQTLLMLTHIGTSLLSKAKAASVRCSPAQLTPAAVLPEPHVDSGNSYAWGVLD